jgi:phage terminase small subunit
LRLEKDFGFTPISRTRLTLEKNQPEEEDYFAI